MAGSGVLLNGPRLGDHRETGSLRQSIGDGSLLVCNQSASATGIFKAIGTKDKGSV